MAYIKNFFNIEELKSLNKSVSEGTDSMSGNIITLKNIEPIINKIKKHFLDEFSIEVEPLRNYLFLASNSTMSYGRAPSRNPQWHTDGTCRLVDGECFNVWVPLYNDSSESGIEVIRKEQNKNLYTDIDPKEHLTIYNNFEHPRIFSALPDTVDLLCIQESSGLILPVSSSNLYIERYENTQPGDIVIFRQSDIHGGFHRGGIRIQLSLKFYCKTAKLNKKSSNQQYKIFESFKNLTEKNNITNVYEHSSKSDHLPKSEFEDYLIFLDQFYHTKKKLSKHGMLELDLVRSLLRG